MKLDDGYGFGDFHGYMQGSGIGNGSRSGFNTGVGLSNGLNGTNGSGIAYFAGNGVNNFRLENGRDGIVTLPWELMLITG